MIELLTPPAKGEPVSPGAKSASGAPGGLDFAALFGSVAPVATSASTSEGVAVSAPTPTTTGIATIAVPTIAVATGVVPPAAASAGAVSMAAGPAAAPAIVPALAPPISAVDGVATTDVATPPIATTQPPIPVADTATDPAPLLVAAVAPPVIDEDGEAVDAAAPASLAGKPVLIKPHGPVVVEGDADVKLPTLPADFVAQKAPRAQPAADDDSQDKDDAAAAEPAAPQLPICAAPIVPTQAPAPDVATAVAAGIVTTRRAGAAPSAKVAEKTDSAAKADIASLGTASSGQPDTLAPVALDTGTRAHGAVGVVADQGANQGAATPQALAVNPAFPITTPAAPPLIDTSSIPVSTQRSIALDDLMVAGAGDSAWLDRLSTDITTLANGDSREAHMKLNPRSLGDISIRLDMDGQSARVHFTVETQQAATLISDSTQKLTSLVQANGLKLDGATVDLNQRRGDGRPSDQPQRQAEAPANFTRARSETARMIERTRIAVATERFA